MSLSYLVPIAYQMVLAQIQAGRILAHNSNENREYLNTLQEYLISILVWNWKVIRNIPFDIGRIYVVNQASPFELDFPESLSYLLFEPTTWAVHFRVSIMLTWNGPVWGLFM